MTEQEWREQFAKQIRRKIVANEIDQKELARLAGTTESCISNYVKGRRFPRGPHMTNLAIALNCTVDELTNFGEIIE